MPFSGKLSLQEALERGLAYNLGAVGVAQTVRQNSAQVTRGPQRSAAEHRRNLSETVEQVDLAALRAAHQRPRLPHSHALPARSITSILQASLNQTSPI